MKIFGTIFIAIWYSYSIINYIKVENEKRKQKYFQLHCR